MASERLTRALEEMDNPAVASVLRAAGACVVEASLERVAEHIVALARVKEAAQIRIDQLSAELELIRGRLCRWSEEAMERRDQAGKQREADRHLINSLNRENTRLLGGSWSATAGGQPPGGAVEQPPPRLGEGGLL